MRIAAKVGKQRDFVFTASILMCLWTSRQNFYQSKNRKSSQILPSGPLKETKLSTASQYFCGVLTLFSYSCTSMCTEVHNVQMCLFLCLFFFNLTFFIQDVKKQGAKFLLLLLTVVAPLVQLLLAVLAAASRGRPPGRRALAGVELPGAVARHGAVLLAWQPPAVSMATQRSEKQGDKRGNDRLASEKKKKWRL